MRSPDTASVSVAYNVGSAVQVPYFASNSQVNLPTIIGPSNFASSNFILSNGYKAFAIGMTMSQNGVLTVQRFLDIGGLIPQDLSPLELELTAGQAAVLNVTDGKPFQSALIQVQNTGTSTAIINPFIMLFQSY